MDSLTHIAIGAIIGEVYAGKSLGRRAMLLGALYQSIPDMDFLGSFFLSPTENLLAHRGLTHSFFFGIIITTAISFFACRKKRNASFGFNNWRLFVGLEILVHLILDGFNAYGVGWFEPFSHQRISYNAIFVVDPLYSVWLVISCIALLILHQHRPSRLKWAWFGLVASSLYLCVCLVNKVIINKCMVETLRSQQISYKRTITTPTTFNNLLWYCIAESDSGYFIGYRSIFDQTTTIDFHYFPRKSTLLYSIKNEKEVKQLLQFSNGFYTVEHTEDGLLFNDLRFGRIAGWENKKTNFTFHYYLQDPQRNNLVVQRGRFAEWNRSVMESLLKRIQGD